MDIKVLIKYQALDVELFKSINKFHAEEEYINGKRLIALLNDKKDTLTKLNAYADDIRKRFSENNINLEKLLKEAIEIQTIISDINDLSELNFHFKKLDGIYQEINRYESILKDLNNSIKDSTDKYKKTFSDAKIYKLKYKEFSDKASALFAEKYEGEQNNIKKNMASLRKKIDEKLFNDYENIKKAKKKFPIVVEYQDNCCLGCGMDIDASLKGKLKSETVIECPNCNRILYVIQD